MTRALCQIENCKPRQTIPGALICEWHENAAWDACQDITRNWPHTETQLLAPTRRGEPIRYTPQPGLNINTWTLTNRATIQQNTFFWAAQLIHHAPTLTVRGDPYNPADLAKFIGANIRHLTRKQTGPPFTTTIIETAHLCTKTAYPQGRRTYTPGIPCTEPGCPGEYQAPVWDGMGYLPDLTCTRDKTHTLTPARFRKLGRNLTTEQAARRFLEAVAGE